MSRFPFMDEPEEYNLEKAVRRAAKKPLPKRFYRQAEAVFENDGFVLKLDGRAARTPARNVLSVPSRGVADALAEEWNRQGEEIDPDTMPFTRIINSAIDAVADRRQEVIDDLVRYAGSDLIVYRAEGPERLVAEQERIWNPVIVWVRDVLGAPFSLAVGIVHVAQPEETIDAVRKAVEEVGSPLALAALYTMTTLSGSVLIALAHARGRLDTAQAWHAAHIDELYQESLWGKDEEAIRRREARESDFKAASKIFLNIS